MGYRPHIIEDRKIEYGDSVYGFNHATDVFIELLDIFEIDYWQDEFYHDFEIQNEEIEKLRELDITKLDLSSIYLSEEDRDLLDLVSMAGNLKDTLLNSLNTKLSKREGYVRIEWV